MTHYAIDVTHPSALLNATSSTVRFFKRTNCSKPDNSMVHHVEAVKQVPTYLFGSTLLTQRLFKP